MQEEKKKNIMALFLGIDIDYIVQNSLRTHLILLLSSFSINYSKVQKEKKNSITKRRTPPQEDRESKIPNHNNAQMSTAQNEYRIVKSMGRGSFGSVFLVEHMKTKQLFVIKKIQMKDINEKEKATIENEVKLLQDLKHINIVSYRDSFIDREGFLNIVMQNCEEGDLYHRIRANPAQKFEEKQIVDWAVQMCLAIHYMHEKRILHRDLKTQNIFLTGGRIRLGDFGISKVLDESQQLTSTMIGTPYYMCPELFKGKSYSYKSDIWALGCVFYEICNQKHAFEAQNFNALGVRVMKGSFSPISSQYSKPLKDLIAKMLTVNARQRPTIIDVLKSPVLKRRVVTYMQECLKLPASEENHIESLIQQAESLGISLQENSSLVSPSVEPKLLNSNRKNSSLHNISNISNSSANNVSHPEVTPRMRGQKSTSDLKEMIIEKGKILREQLQKEKKERERMQEEIRKLEEKRRNDILQREKEKRARTASQEKLRRFSASEKRLNKEESSLIKMNQIDTKPSKLSTEIGTSEPSPKSSSMSGRSFNKKSVPELVVLPKIDAHKKEFKMQEDYDMNFEEESDPEEGKMEDIHEMEEEDEKEQETENVKNHENNNNDIASEEKGISSYGHAAEVSPPAPVAADKIQKQQLQVQNVELMKSKLKEKSLRITLLQTELQKIDFEVSDSDEDEHKPAPLPHNPKFINVQERIKSFRNRIENIIGTGGFGEMYATARSVEGMDAKEGRAKVLGVLEPKHIGLWHLMDQILSLQRVLKDIPEYC